MKVAALGIACPLPPLSLPPVDLLVLPELGFSPWVCATREVDPRAWVPVTPRLEEVDARVIVGTVAVIEDGRRYNDALVYFDGAVQATHRKTFLPDEPGFWEATWYARGPVDFTPVETPVGRLGISICTEMWFTQHAFADVDVVVVPRATPADTSTKWLAGGATQAVCAGAFCVSSNRAETVAGTTMGGTGWVIDPDGEVLAVTGAESAVVVDIDLEQARAAKRTYPRYVATD